MAEEKAAAAAKCAIHFGYCKEAAAASRLYLLLSAAGELFTDQPAKAAESAATAPTTPVPALPDPAAAAADAVAAAAAAVAAAAGAAAGVRPEAAASSYTAQTLSRYQLHVLRGEETKLVRRCVAAGSATAKELSSVGDVVALKKKNAAAPHGVLIFSIYYRDYGTKVPHFYGMPLTAGDKVPGPKEAALPGALQRQEMLLANLVDKRRCTVVEWKAVHDSWLAAAITAVAEAETALEDIEKKAQAKQEAAAAPKPVKTRSAHRAATGEEKKLKTETVEGEKAAKAAATEDDDGKSEEEESSENEEEEEEEEEAEEPVGRKGKKSGAKQKAPAKKKPPKRRRSTRAAASKVKKAIAAAKAAESETDSDDPPLPKKAKAAAAEAPCNAPVLLASPPQPIAAAPAVPAATAAAQTESVWQKLALQLLAERSTGPAAASPAPVGVAAGLPPAAASAGLPFHLTGHVPSFSPAGAAAAHAAVLAAEMTRMAQVAEMGRLFQQASMYSSFR